MAESNKQRRAGMESADFSKTYDEIMSHERSFVASKTLDRLEAQDAFSDKVSGQQTSENAPPSAETAHSSLVVRSMGTSAKGSATIATVTLASQPSPIFHKGDPSTHKGQGKCSDGTPLIKKSSDEYAVSKKTPKYHERGYLTGSSPIEIVCTNCYQQIETEVVRVPKMKAVICCWVLICLLLWCFAFIPLCLDRCREDVHRCPECKVFYKNKDKFNRAQIVFRSHSPKNPASESPGN
ncbi:uncharacterized protein LOC142339897 [Convolutriloba macropyga]|uniref:uncharacterized protein LOC142339897 n=1 Tax=Convolutriloba macropyga TaxID=536237 RepID=UPI003F523624